MSVSELSASTQNYLKVVWAAAEWSEAPVTPSVIAERSGRGLSTVSEAIRKLVDQGLVTHSPYGAVELTEIGRTHALAMVRRHRLIETFLVKTLGYRWDEVHEEAEHLEHAVSDLMIDRVDAFLGFPTRDPHGDPIPSASGAFTLPEAVQLTHVAPGQAVTVERISDDDPGLLQFFEEQSIDVQSVLLVAAGTPYSDTIDVTTESGVTVTLGNAACSALYVSTQ